MHDKLLLDDLVKSVLQEIGKFGLAPGNDHSLSTNI